MSSDASLDELRDWLALYQWELLEGEQILADEADVALVHLDDGYSDEFDLRLRLSGALERYESTYDSFGLDSDLRPFMLGAIVVTSEFVSRRIIDSGSLSSNTQQVEQFILTSAM